jgi:hypothetical protein
MLKILCASLGEQEIRDFLTTKVLNLHFGTVDEKGHVNIQKPISNNICVEG